MSLLRNKLPNLFHPASGLLILAVDWLLFSGSILTLGLSTPVLTVLGFIAGALLVTWIQVSYTDDTRRAGMWKGLIGGIVVGLPLPIAGTGAAGLILTLSGLDRLSLLGDGQSNNSDPDDGKNT